MKLPYATGQSFLTAVAQVVSKYPTFKNYLKSVAMLRLQNTISNTEVRGLAAEQAFLWSYKHGAHCCFPRRPLCLMTIVDCNRALAPLPFAGERRVQPKNVRYEDAD